MASKFEKENVTERRVKTQYFLIPLYMLFRATLQVETAQRHLIFKILTIFKFTVYIIYELRYKQVSIIIKHAINVLIRLK